MNFGPLEQQSYGPTCEIAAPRGPAAFRTCISHATQPAKTTLFCPGRAAGGNEADVRQTRRSALGRPEVDPKGAVQGWSGTQTRRSAFGRPEVDPKGAVQGRSGTQTRRSAFGRPKVDPKGAVQG